MAPLDPDRLYRRLPAVHRLRDTEHGRSLQALLRAAAEQAEVVEQSLDRLWDDLFVETCDPWVVAYLGDLLAVEPLAGGGAPARVDVAKTISYRRRKGTLPMLEELSRDVTGWGGHAAEMLEALGWTQHLAHLRPQAAWFDLRDPVRADAVDGPFDAASRSVDVRPPSDGLHAIGTVAFHLYRLRSYPVQGVVLPAGGGSVHVRPRPTALGGNRFHVGSLGSPTRLFTRWRPEGDVAGLATEAHVPGPIRPAAFHRDLAALAADPGHDLAFYGPAALAGLGDDCFPGPATPASGGSLAVFVDDVAVPADRVLCKDLSTWQQPPSGSDLLAVDVTRGRVAFAADAVLGEVTVEYHYGFPGDVGAGPYDRRRVGPPTALHRGFGPDTVGDPLALAGSRIGVSAVGDHVLVGDALAEWQGAPGDLPPVVIEVQDDRTYAEDLVIDVTRARRVVLQAANGSRPTLVGDITIAGDNPAAVVTLDGLLVAGRVEVTGRPGRLHLAHCTLVPGGGLDEDGEPLDATAAGLVVGASAEGLAVLVEACVCGPVRAPEGLGSLTVVRSVLDGIDGVALAAADGGFGPPTVLDQVTVLGAVRVRRLDLASEVVATGRVEAQRTQDGCVRFSYVPPGSRTPRRFRCQPDLALAAAGPDPVGRARVLARLRPAFTSTRYGDPAYTQLARACPQEVSTGGEDGTEMGAWAWLRAPHREADLRSRLEQYLPMGLTPALVTVT